MKYYREKFGRILEEYFSKRADELPQTKLPPPPMPQVKPPKENSLNGYTAEQMRALVVPKIEYIYGQLMQQMVALSAEGKCALVTNELGFNQETLDPMRQKIVDKLKDDGYQVYFIRNDHGRLATSWCFKW